MTGGRVDARDRVLGHWRYHFWKYSHFRSTFNSESTPLAPCSPILSSKVLFVTTAMSFNLPWDKVRGDVLRDLVKDFGLRYSGLKRMELVELLEAVERDGSTFIMPFYVMMKLIHSILGSS